MSDLERLGSSVVTPLQVFWTELVSFVPNLLAATILLIIGYGLGKLLRLGAEGLARRAGLDRFAQSVGIDDLLGNVDKRLVLSKFIGLVLFWFVFLAFFISAADALELPRFSNAIDQVVQYLPNVLAALAILLVGIYLARRVRDLVRRNAAAVGLEYGQALSSVIHLLVVVITVSLAIAQLQVETGLLNQVVVIILITLGIAAALALGLGGRGVAENVLAGIYLRDLLESDAEIECGDVQGRLLSITAVKTIVVDGVDHYAIANRQVLDSVTRTRSGQ